MKIMLIVMSIINLDDVLERAFNLAAKEDGELFLTFIQEGKTPSSLSSLLMNSGFLGEKVQTDVENTVKEEYKRQAKTILEEIEERAESKGVKVVETEQLKKNNLNDCYKIIKENKIDYLFLNFTDHKTASRTLFEYISEDFVKKLNIPYEMFMDGKKKLLKQDR